MNDKTKSETIYPFEFRTKDIKTKQREYTNNIRNFGAGGTTEMFLKESMLLQIGANEIQKRKNRIPLFISWFALLVSIVAIGLNVYFSTTNALGNAEKMERLIGVEQANLILQKEVASRLSTIIASEASRSKDIEQLSIKISKYLDKK